MMVLSALRPDSSLPESLAYRARTASFRRLAFDLLIGIGGATAALWWRPQYWLLLASASACFFAYGGWGLADRVRSRESTQRNEAFRFLADVGCGIMAGLGTLALAALLYSIWAIALGTWIS